MSKENNNSSQRKYITLTEGQDFRSISRVMTNNSYKMNHATARNQITQAIHSLLMEFAKEAKGTKVKSSDIDNILNKQKDIYEAIGEVLYSSLHDDLTSQVSVAKQNKNK